MRSEVTGLMRGAGAGWSGVARSCDMLPKSCPLAIRGAKLDGNRTQSKGFAGRCALAFAARRCMARPFRQSPTRESAAEPA